MESLAGLVRRAGLAGSDAPVAGGYFRSAHEHGQWCNQEIGKDMEGTRHFCERFEGHDNEHACAHMKKEQT